MNRKYKPLSTIDLLLIYRQTQIERNHKFELLQRNSNDEIKEQIKCFNEVLKEMKIEIVVRKNKLL